MIYTGIYGSSKAPCIIYEYNGWYVIEGSENVNYTEDIFYNGIDLETVSDIDYFSADYPIFSVEDLQDQLSFLDN